MRALVLVAMLAGCLDVEPVRDYEVQLTYAGERFVAVFEYPTYSFDADHPAHVQGVLIEGAAPITRADLEAREVVTLTFEVERLDDDPGANPIECTIDPDDLDRATGCTGSRHSCSAIVGEVP
ncbi:MAG: hypothetical protein ABI867_41940 [Kofleriaceae bacterium]